MLYIYIYQYHISHGTPLRCLHTYTHVEQVKLRLRSSWSLSGPCLKPGNLEPHGAPIADIADGEITTIYHVSKWVKHKFMNGKNVRSC